MTEWQPIETFFKRQDRTGKVLLFVPGYGVTEANCEFTGFYVWKGAGREFRSGSPEDRDAPKGCAPTHWMPLPQPPQSERTGA